MIPIINRPTRVMRNTAIASDNFITNTVVYTEFKSGIIQIGNSNHFQISFALKTNENIVGKHSEYFGYKRYYDKKSKT